jgi:adenylosuccinate lyase
MEDNGRFTDGRVPDAGIRVLLADTHRWQCWLDIEASLASAEAKEGLIPSAAAVAIARKAVLKDLDISRIRVGIHKTSHPLMALITELSDAVGEPYGGWVHWGATTQNITQTGDALVLREVHGIFLGLLGRTFSALEALAMQGKDMVCAGRTHGQQAVPITFGFKVAAWIDELQHHVIRLRQVEPRIFTAMLGGAVGNFASLGEKGPAVQARIARKLALQSMAVPSRAMSDAQAEYVCILALLAGTAGKMAKEVYLLMQPEFGEAQEPAPSGTVGSSTMPHKRNPQLADDCIAIGAQIRSLVPLAMEGMLHDHEVSGAYSLMSDEAIKQACLLTGDLLTRLVVITSGLELNSLRMRANLDLTEGLINSEAVMLYLGKSIGRQRAHEIAYQAAQQAAQKKGTFKELLLNHPDAASHLDSASLTYLLDPNTHIGLSASIAQEAAHRAHTLATQLRHANKDIFW